MAKYEVTLTIPVRVHGERQERGTVVEVDDVLLEELEKHNAVTNVKEKDSANDDDQNVDESTVGNDTDDGDTNGDGYLTVEEIKALLDARNIDYKGVRKRDELLALLEAEEGE